MNQHPITVIQAGRRDLHAIHEILAADAEEREASAQDAIQEFDEALAHDDFLSRDYFWILLAMQDGKVVGYLSAVKIPKGDKAKLFIYVDELWVLRSHRRKGAGRALIERIEAIGREAGAYGIRLTTEFENSTAQAFYRKMGFRLKKDYFCEKVC